MNEFGDRLLQSKFFVDPHNTGSKLTPGEVKYTILQSFPQAKHDDIRHLAVPGLIMTQDYPLKGNVAISVERVIEAKTLYINSTHTITLPVKQEEPIAIRTAGLISLCGKELNCEQGHYTKIMNNKGTEIYSLKEYLIVYNCIGWALGIRDWINPSSQECNYSASDFLSCFANLTQNFLNFISIKYNSNSEKKAFVQEDVISKLNKIAYCSEELPDINLINQEGTIAFYFKNGVMTHAARFVHELEGYVIDSWISKLGHDIMISHKLEDLAGNNSLYGNPLCYLIPTKQMNCTIDAIGQCINETQIQEV